MKIDIDLKKLRTHICHVEHNLVAREELHILSPAANKMQNLTPTLLFTSSYVV